MTLRDAADLLAQRAVKTRLAQQQGASSFFAKPNKSLDPHLFGVSRGDWFLLPDVRRWILETLYRFWSDRYVAPHQWSQVWLAGSGITYQWDAPRAVGEPGDLDVLVGVDFPTFWASNPSYHGLGEKAMAEYFNDQFRATLSPTMAHQNFNGQTYEVTFYVNPGATDIRNINPYAAYNVSRENWTVRPPELSPEWNPYRELPASWWERFDTDKEQAQSIFRTYDAQVGALRDLRTSDPRWVNHATILHGVIDQGRRLFDEIHQARHTSFAPDGGGYTGYANVRWQAGKQGGYLHNLHMLKNLWESAHADRVLSCYGSVPLDAAHALTIASLVGAAHTFD